MVSSYRRGPNEKNLSALYRKNNDVHFDEEQITAIDMGVAMQEDKEIGGNIIVRLVVHIRLVLGPVDGIYVDPFLDHLPQRAGEQ